MWALFHNFQRTLLVEIRTLVAWLKWTLLLKIRCFYTHIYNIYMKTQCFWLTRSFPEEFSNVLFFSSILLKIAFELHSWIVYFFFFTWRNKLTLITYVHDAVVIVAVVIVAVVSAVVDRFDYQIFKDNLSPPETWTNFSNSMANFPMGVPPTEVVRAYWILSQPACSSLKG